MTMGDLRTIRAWKDADYRASLLVEEGIKIPESPVGSIELADDDLDPSGGSIPQLTQTSICTTSLACVIAGTIAVSNTVSCNTCETTLWHGTCGASSIGCC
jgi:mersacidin/lichenicidin family type 2 lantibiotic